MQAMQQLAASRGGKCLSDTYVNNQTKLLWQCHEGHQWKAIPNSIKRGTWCPVCADTTRGNALRITTIEHMQKLAEERGGKCLSNTYINESKKLLWECKFGHKWQASTNPVKRGTWCPECSSGLGERICRAYFEQLFGEEFPKSYPKWLVNERGNQMELDGYCRSLNLAFEHHGEQHFSKNSHYIKTERAFIARQKDDELKLKLCKENQVVLIIIPEIPNRLAFKNIRTYIKKKSNDYSVPIPSDFDSKNINLKEAYTTSRSAEAIKLMNQLARKKRGICLSDIYINARTKILWKCKNGHQWAATPNNIQQGAWCPHCYGNVRAEIKELQQLALQYAGKCLSDTYVNNHTKLLWECKEAHQWNAIPTSIKHGTWCPVCAITRRGNALRITTIDHMQKLAKQKGGKCLSNAYKNNKTKLLWECAKGHRWQAMPVNVKRGTWCPECSGRTKGSILGMRDLAKQRGGRCFSDTYINAHTKLFWECKDGHRWRATPAKIKQGTWCPICSNKRKKSKKQI